MSEYRPLPLIHNHFLKLLSFSRVTVLAFLRFKFSDNLETVQMIVCFLYINRFTANGLLLNSVNACHGGKGHGLTGAGVFNFQRAVGRECLKATSVTGPGEGQSAVHDPEASPGVLEVWRVQGYIALRSCSFSVTPCQRAQQS